MANSDSPSPAPAPFTVVLRGYDREQVNQTFQRYQADLRLMSADRDAASSHARELTELLDDAQDEIDNLRREVDRLAVPPTTAEGMSDRIARMMRLASDEASEIRAQAEAEAAETRSLAQQDAEEERRTAERLRADMETRRTAMEAEHAKTLDAAKAEAKRIVADAHARSEQHDRSAQEDRDRVQSDFDMAMSMRRDRAISTITELEDASKSEARDRVDAANSRAEQLIAEANATADRAVEEANTAAAAQVAEARRITEELQDLRGSILRQLDVVRGQLEKVPGHLEAREDEATKAAQTITPAAVTGAVPPHADHAPDIAEPTSTRARSVLSTGDFEPAKADDAGSSDRHAADPGDTSATSDQGSSPDASDSSGVAATPTGSRGSAAGSRARAAQRRGAHEAASLDDEFPDDTSNAPTAPFRRPGSVASRAE